MSWGTSIEWIIGAEIYELLEEWAWNSISRAIWLFGTSQKLVVFSQRKKWTEPNENKRRLRSAFYS